MIPYLHEKIQEIRWSRFLENRLTNSLTHSLTTHIIYTDGPSYSAHHYLSTIIQFIKVTYYDRHFFKFGLYIVVNNLQYIYHLMAKTFLILYTFHFISAGKKNYKFQINFNKYFKDTKFCG